MNFKGRTAIVTGVGSERGFGAAISNYMAEGGCNIICVNRHVEGAERIAKTIQETYGVKTCAIKADISEFNQVKSMIDESIATFGKIDILINNAGISERVGIEDMSIEQWDRMIRIDLYGTFFCSKLIVPHMRANHYGRIVTVSSVAGKRGGGVFGSSHYAAAKAGQLGFSKALARETALDGITVNCVCPGACKTDLGGIRFEEKKVMPEILMGRRGENREVAAAVAFLASEDASYITGEEIDVNGGLHID